MKIILLGAPGAGKGSQAPFLTAKYGVPQISTGDAFRENIREGTPVGVLAKSYIDKGQLVPDEVVVRIVKERIEKEDCVNGFILDGFPRTIAQAEALETLTDIDCVLDFEVDTSILVKRLTGRLSCKCGAVYHASRHESNICDKCGGTLYTRDDDKEETILKRIAVYEKETAPLKEFYEKRGLLVVLDAGTSVEETQRQIEEKLA